MKERKLIKIQALTKLQYSYVLHTWVCRAVKLIGAHFHRMYLVITYFLYPITFLVRFALNVCASNNADQGRRNWGGQGGHWPPQIFQD